MRALAATVLSRLLRFRAAARTVTVAENLRLVAASATADGRLPPVGPHRVHARRGKDKPCACCGKVITAAQIQYDLELIKRPWKLAAPLHLACYEAWYAAAESSLTGGSAAIS